MNSKLEIPSTTLEFSENGARIPNCLYVGTSKAGSTWIFDLLARQKDVYAAPGKGIYYFTSHFERGQDWYLSHFSRADQEDIVLEISHNYLHSAEACERIAELNPKMKILVCVREPVARAFSDYLDYVKNGKFSGSFGEARSAIPSVVDRGRYAAHLRPYIEKFGRERVHVGVFDDLANSPQAFADEMFSFLGIPQYPLPESRQKKMMPAGRPRSERVSLLTKSVAKQLKKVGLRPLMGRIKRSRTVRNALYKAYDETDKPRPTEEETRTLREQYREEIVALDDLLGTDLVARWKYDV